MTGDLINGSTTLADYSDKIAEINYTFIGKRKERYSPIACTLSDNELIKSQTVSKAQNFKAFIKKIQAVINLILTPTLRLRRYYHGGRRTSIRLTEYSARRA